MDSDHVDRLSRTLAATLSRRTSLGLATLLGLAPVAGTEAKKRKKKKKKKKCPSGYTACGKQCFDLSDNTQHCGSCATVCSPGKACCQGTCVNLQDDDRHCAACGKRCRTNDHETPRLDAAEICQAGACVDCSIEGTLRDVDPQICCRGLKFCPGDAGGTTPARCRPPSEAC